MSRYTCREWKKYVLRVELSAYRSTAWLASFCPSSDIFDSMSNVDEMRLDVSLASNNPTKKVGREYCIQSRGGRRRLERQTAVKELFKPFADDMASPIA
jgi:hypothetical protein